MLLKLTAAKQTLKYSKFANPYGWDSKKVFGWKIFSFRNSLCPIIYFTVNPDLKLASPKVAANIRIKFALLDNIEGSNR